MQLNRLNTLAAAMAGFATVATAAPEVHVFTSADGTKKLSASVVNATQSPKGVTAELLRADTKQRTTVFGSAFTAADQEYLIKQANIFEAARAVQISLTFDQDKWTKPSEEQGRRIATSDAHYSLECRNIGPAAVEGVEVDYQIFVKRERRLTPTKGEKKAEVIKGSVEIPALASSGSHSAQTGPVELTSDRPNLGGKGCRLSGG